MAPRLTLMAMPPEIIIEIYVQLSNFRDVFALVAACRRFSAVWCENATSIYRALAPSEIGFLELARQLLADQGGAPTNSDTLTANDVRRMVRNSYKANKAAGVFGQEVAPKTGSRLISS
ncbi:hypothetical protein F4801DRAFT_255261 [Xylaria longipes]|nr:hypothetical protein F4801DRAFT_255261 [Xylaria longipes]